MMSPSGTFETYSHVRSRVAIRGIADIEQAALNKLDLRALDAALLCNSSLPLLYTLAARGIDVGDVSAVIEEGGGFGSLTGKGP
jgi:hypothetical protein